MTALIFYRTTEPKTPKIDRDWTLKERLAFKRPANLASELMQLLPADVKKTLGDYQPTDPTFRKLAHSYGKVSELWLQVGRSIGIWDFSVEQAAFIQLAVYLDSINVRIRLNLLFDRPTKANSLEYFCLKEPDYQGVIRFTDDRLTVPDNLFEKVLRKQLDVFRTYCDYLDDILMIPGEQEASETDENPDNVLLESVYPQRESANQVEHIDLSDDGLDEKWAAMMENGHQPITSPSQPAIDNDGNNLTVSDEDISQMLQVTGDLMEHEAEPKSDGDTQT